MDIVPLDIERKSAAIHAFMMLERRQTHALGESCDLVEDLRAVHRVLNVSLVVLALERIDVLLEQPLIELRLAYIVQESCHHDVLRHLAVKMHPLGKDTRENRHAQRVVVDVARKMIELIEIVDRSATARERQKILLHHLIGLLNRHLPRLLCLLKDRFCRADDIFILLNEQIAARKDR